MFGFSPVAAAPLADNAVPPFSGVLSAQRFAAPVGSANSGRTLVGRNGGRLPLKRNGGRLLLAGNGGTMPLTQNGGRLLRAENVQS
jgi:hypothetical protein